MLVQLVLLTLLVSSIDACKSNGACGCCGGCRARARGVKNAKTSGDTLVENENEIFGLSIWNKTDLEVNEKSYARLTNPNHLFHICCEERGLPSACTKHCHFNEYSGKVLEEIFVGNHECPAEFIAEMQFCAAQGSDHRKCCSRSGVSETTAGDKCLLFCDQRPDKYTPVDYSYAPCFERFEDMKMCFYNNIHKKADRKFEPLLKKSKAHNKEKYEWEGKNIE